MLPIRRILAPTDFSERSHGALDAAAEMADHFGAEVLVTHIISPVPTPIPAAAGQMPIRLDVDQETVLEDTESRVDDLVKERVPPDVKVRTEVRWGRPAETIVEMAEEHGADLIVISTRGATGLSRFVSGSVTEKVVRLSEVPVLTVQAEDHD